MLIYQRVHLFRSSFLRLMRGGIIIVGLLATSMWSPATAVAESAEANPKIHAGINAGEKIPAFKATDQNGREQTWQTLAGRNGLVLLFYRSADW